MSAVGNTLQSLGVEQYLLAFLFLASYSMALGHFRTGRGRMCSLACTFAAAIAFTAFTDPWEHGILLVVLALVGMGFFGAAVWAMWAMLGWPHEAPPADEPEEAAPPTVPAPPEVSTSNAWQAIWRWPRKLARDGAQR